MRHERWVLGMVFFWMALFAFQGATWAGPETRKDPGETEKKSIQKKKKKPRRSLEDRLRRVGRRLRRDQLELERILLEDLKKERSTTQAPQAAPKVDVSGMEEKLSDLDERLSGLEDDVEGMLGVQDKLLKRVKKDKLRWSASYRAVVNNFHLVDKSYDTIPDHLELVVDDFGQPVIDPSTGQVMATPVYTQVPRNLDKWYGSQWLNRLRLTMTWDVTDSLRFYGQIGVFKYFNELQNEPTTLDMHTNRYPRDPTLRIERAYFDWFIWDWLVLTIGRVSSPEGPPAELKENTVRNATWGVQMVEAEMEAVMLTFHLSGLLENTYFRMYYIPFLDHMDFSLADDRFLFMDSGIKPMHAYGALFEMKIPKVGDNLLQIGYVCVPQFRPRNIDISVPWLEEKVSPSEPTGQDLGSYWMVNGLLEFKNIADSGLDLFAAYALSILQPREDRMIYDVPVSLPIVHPLTGQQVGTYDGTTRVETGLASYEEGNGTTNFGHMFYLGFRYTFPWFGDYKVRIGAEVNHGSKYHINWNSPSDLLVNRLGTKGWAWEVYYIQQLIKDHLFARLGYLQLIRDYQGLHIGPTVPIDQTIDNAYLLMEAKW